CRNRAMWVSNADDACATVAVAVISRRLLAGATFRNPCRVRYDSAARTCAVVGAYAETNCELDIVRPEPIADTRAARLRTRRPTTRRSGVEAGAAPSCVAARRGYARVAVGTHFVPEPAAAAGVVGAAGIASARAAASVEHRRV